jgi:hypothetical protein
MTVCAVCKKSNEKGVNKKVYTGEYVTSFFPNGDIRIERTEYQNIMEHSVFVCNNCDKKESRLYLLWGIPIFSLMCISGIASIKGSYLYCLLAMAIPMIGIGILELYKKITNFDVENFIKNDALRQRHSLGLIGNSAFSESEYSSLRKF